MTFGARPIELSRIWSWFKALMLALHRDWSGLPSGSSDSPGYTSIESTLRGGALSGSLRGRLGAVMRLCVQFFLRVDGKETMHFQHWELSNFFVENRSDEQCNVRDRCA
jgi:hypothetical protein